jgi:formylglycine-generating enzyme required for sulfatase activity
MAAFPPGFALQRGKRPAAGAGRRAAAAAAAWLGLGLLSACTWSAEANPAFTLPASWFRKVDGAEMVYVLAGEFSMGSGQDDAKATADEQPAHTISLDEFWIDRTEITNARYVQFLNDLGRHRGACDGYDCAETKVEDRHSHILFEQGQYRVEPGYEAHPATQVTWYGASAYCAWAGARLPSEAEWEKAARGVESRPYPWGEAAPDCNKAQFGDCGGMTVPVGSKPAGASPCGALDMAGNVWEWTADWYDPDYYGVSPAKDPKGPDSGLRKVFRGGSWGYPGTFMRASDRARNRPTYAGFNVGFRCAK